MAHYLCKEHGEEFLVEASSLEEAQKSAEVWGGEAICEVKVISKNGNEIEFERPF